MMVWTNQFSCCESSILHSVFNLYRILSSSSVPRPLAYRHSLPHSNRYCIAVLKSETKSSFSYPQYRLKYVGLNSRWVGYVTTTLQLKTFVERFSTSRYDSPISILPKDYSFHILTLCESPPASWSTIRGWGRLSVQGVDKRVKCSISHSLRAAVSCVETAHPSSLHVSIKWFSCKLGPLIKGIGACTFRARWTSTRSLTGE
jgi:hypothetical protein